MAFPDPRWMREALDLARQGEEAVSPNPMVGCVVVRDGRVIARGWHRAYGDVHAEVDALRQLSARRARGADLYVTLEPCAHEGKQPPCADAVIAAGVARVAYAVGDPNPLTRGRGARRLRAAGVETHAGLLRREAAELNRPFFHFHRTGLPWVILKWAMSLDGKIATTTGESKWITSKAARAHGHSLRRRVDAIVAGTGTILADDPRLTPRPARGRKPWRVLLDRRGELPLDLRLLEAGARGGPRLYVTSPRAPAERLAELRERGLETLVLPERELGLDLEYLLTELAERGVSQLLVEGGGELAGSLVTGGWVREIAAFVAPSVLGGRDAPTPVGGLGIPALDDRLRLSPLEVTPLGPDLAIRAIVEPR